MALKKSVLKKHLTKIMNDPPKTFKDAAIRWANMYHEYAAGALAGVMKPSGFSKIVIKKQILDSTDDFYTGIEKGLSLYWKAVIWAGTGFTGVTKSAKGIDVKLGGKAKDLKAVSVEDVEEAREIVGITEVIPELGPDATQDERDERDELDEATILEALALQAADIMASAIHAHATSITVTATQTSSGATSIVKVM
jgi:hypothetical protein